MWSELFEFSTLEEVASIHDSNRIPVKKSERKSGDYPYYGASGITDYVDEYIFDGNYVLLAEDGDNLRTRNTPIAFMATGKFWVNNHAHILKGKNGNDTDFICYSLQVADIKSYISGSTRPKITQRDMRKIRIFCPPLPEQKAIAHILGSLDDKIELNRQINQTLEAMALALFKSWFVDFDPVIDNALAAGNPIPESLQAHANKRKKNVGWVSGSVTQQQQELLKQLPNEFEFNEELGWVPKGWSVKSIDEIISINPKLALKKGVVASFADMKAIPTSGYAINNVIQKEYKGGARFQNDDVLFARITPCLENGKTGVVDFLKGDEIGFGSTEFIVFRGKGCIRLAFVACLSRNNKFRTHAKQSMVGSSGRQRVQNACFSSYFLAIPESDELLNLFDEMVNVNFEKSSKLATETLTKLRDTLLPKLLSGELRIPDAEKLIENAII